MAGNYTLTIIKPDAFSTRKTGNIIAHLEQQGFSILASRVLHMSQAEAGEFYAVHRERPFYGSLVSFMTSGPCMPMILEKTDAVAALRAPHALRFSTEHDSLSVPCPPFRLWLTML